MTRAHYSGTPYGERRSDTPTQGRRFQTFLTATNKKRKALNATHNQRLAPPTAIQVKYSGQEPKAQDMRLWPVLILQAAATNRECALQNALRVEVSTVDQQQCTLLREGGAPLTIPVQQVPTYFRLVHAITYDSSQARTLFNGIKLTELDHPHTSLRRLIVGLGRSPKGEDVQVE